VVVKWCDSTNDVSRSWEEVGTMEKKGMLHMEVRFRAVSKTLIINSEFTIQFSETIRTCVGHLRFHQNAANFQKVL
jgi:hypothetical protein